MQLYMGMLGTLIWNHTWQLSMSFVRECVMRDWWQTMEKPALEDIHLLVAKSSTTIIALYKVMVICFNNLSSSCSSE